MSEKNTLVDTKEILEFVDDDSANIAQRLDLLLSVVEPHSSAPVSETAVSETAVSQAKLRKGKGKTKG